MKKLLSCMIAATMLSVSSIPMSADAADMITRQDYPYVTLITQYWGEEEPAVRYFPYILDYDVDDLGYLYIMENAEVNPAVKDVTPLSNMLKKSDGTPINNEYGVLIIENAMSKYGDVYYSEELATDMTDVSKIINIQARGTILIEFRPKIKVYLDYKSVDEFEADKDELIEKLSARLPDDGYGYEFDNNAYEYSDGVIAAFIDSKAYKQGIETEVSKILKVLSDNALHFSPSAWENAYFLADALYGCEKVLGADLADTHDDKGYGPGISGSVVNENQIEYNVVYSAVPTNGDYNNDGLLEITDAQNLLTYSAAHVAGTTESLPIVSSAPENMDVDGDGEITIADAQYVLTYCAQQAAGMDPTWEDILK